MKKTKKTADQILAAQRLWAPSPTKTIFNIDRAMGMSQVRYTDGSSEWCTHLELSSWAERVEGVDGASARYERGLALTR